MIYRPKTGSMWDPSVIWHDGKYYNLKAWSMSLLAEESFKMPTNRLGSGIL